MTPISLDLLRSLAADPASRSAYSPLAQRHCLVIDAAESARDIAVINWLKQLPCPSIAIAGEETDLSRTCDIVVPDLAAAAQLAEKVQKRPIAATVLVQLLRGSGNLPVENGLIAESLAYSTLQSGPEFQGWLKGHRAPEPRKHSDTGPAVEMQRIDNTLHLTLNRASNHNAMTVEMRDALVEALQLVLSDPGISQVMLAARGKCFSSGGDLTEFGTAPDPATAHLVRSLALPARLLAQCASRVKITVHGACIGSGIEFPAFAGHVAAMPDAWFQLPELSFGLIPGAGGCIAIARRIGRQRLAQWVISGKRIDAETALQWQLIDEVVGRPPDPI